MRPVQLGDLYKLRSRPLVIDGQRYVVTSWHHHFDGTFQLELLREGAFREHYEVRVPRRRRLPGLLRSRRTRKDEAAGAGTASERSGLNAERTEAAVGDE